MCIWAYIHRLSSLSHLVITIIVKLNVIQKCVFAYISGGIPLEIGNLSHLEILGIQGISLRGTIPSFVFNISSLRRINLANNSLSGSLPVDICHNLHELEMLFLQSNQLTGQISNILECKRLQVIFLSDNNFTGGIPTKLGNLTELQYLYLHNNKFTGTIIKFKWIYYNVLEVNFHFSNVKRKSLLKLSTVRLSIFSRIVIWYNSSKQSHAAS